MGYNWLSYCHIRTNFALFLKLKIYKENLIFFNMHTKTIKELEKEYDFEFDKIVKTIKQKKAKLVLLQFPDGIKPYATTIVDELEGRTSATFFIWLGSCFGACDIPKVDEQVDLIVQFGHSEFKGN